jgi:hypothetical protein
MIDHQFKKKKDNKTSDKTIEQRLLSQCKLVDEKIKELEMMHLFLRV